MKIQSHWCYLVSVQKPLFFHNPLLFAKIYHLNIKYMQSKGTSCGAPAGKFIEGLGLKEKLSSLDGHSLPYSCLCN
jgi:hypothetical protein